MKKYNFAKERKKSEVEEAEEISGLKYFIFISIHWACMLTH